MSVGEHVALLLIKSWLGNPVLLIIISIIRILMGKIMVTESNVLLSRQNLGLVFFILDTTAPNGAYFKVVNISSEMMSAINKLG